MSGRWSCEGVRDTCLGGGHVRVSEILVWRWSCEGVRDTRLGGGDVRVSEILIWEVVM